MATRRKEASKRGASGSAARSLDIAERGIKTSRDFRDFMSALMSDVISGAVTPQITNAACNAGGKMLKMVDLEYKYGTRPEKRQPVLSMAFEDRAVAVPVEAKALAAG